VCWLHTTEPPAHPEDGDGVTSRNVRNTSHIDAAVCPRKLHRILSPRKLQDLYDNLSLFPNSQFSGSKNVKQKQCFITSFPHLSISRLTILFTAMSFIYSQREEENKSQTDKFLFIY
jgi:hypothetical protein